MEKKGKFRPHFWAALLVSGVDLDFWFYIFAIKPPAGAPGRWEGGLGLMIGVQGQGVVSLPRCCTRRCTVTGALRCQRQFRRSSSTTSTSPDFLRSVRSVRHHFPGAIRKAPADFLLAPDGWPSQGSGLCQIYCAVAGARNRRTVSSIHNKSFSPCTLKPDEFTMGLRH